MDGVEERIAAWNAYSLCTCPEPIALMWGNEPKCFSCVSYMRKLRYILAFEEMKLLKETKIEELVEAML